MHNLKIIKTENGATKVLLDDFEIQDVEECQLKSSANEVTELTLKLFIGSCQVES
jgi:hypothetical protein